MNRTSNEILFDCVYDILKGRSTYSKRAFDFVWHWDLHEGVEIEENFSHDNWKGVYAWFYMFAKDELKRFPLFGRHSWNPFNFIQFVWMKYPKNLLFYPLRLFTMLRMIIQCAFVLRRDNQGRPHTSGRLLDYYVCKAYGMSKTLKVMTYFIDREKDFKGWDGVFLIYFKPGHRVHNAYFGVEDE